MAEEVYEGVCVLGSAPATVGLAPFNDPKWLIYTCSPHNFEHRELPRFDMWFEVHKKLEDKTRSQEYLDYLKTIPALYMRDLEAIKKYPNAIPYPEEEMDEKFGPYYKQSSISLIQAVAIRDCEKLHAEGKMPEPKMAYFGIMQRGQTEYLYQKATIQHMAFNAQYEKLRKKLGLPVIKQYAPRQSDLWAPVPEVW